MEFDDDLVDIGCMSFLVMFVIRLSVIICISLTLSRTNVLVTEDETLICKVKTES